MVKTQQRGASAAVTESQHGRGWRGPLWVAQPNPLPKQGHPEQAAQHLVASFYARDEAADGAFDISLLSARGVSEEISSGAQSFAFPRCEDAAR